MHDQKLRILITGGGSGGHIIPSLAIIDAVKNICKKQKTTVDTLYICSRSKLDKKILKDHKISFRSIFTWKFRRYFDIWNILEAFTFPIGIIQSFYHILTFKPQVVFAKGGYVSTPVCIAAYILRKPIIAHESDTIPGMANRFIAKVAKTICSGFQSKNKKYVYTGNPLRNGVINGDKKAAYKYLDFTSNKKTLLIVGGSQGALIINQNIEKILPELVKEYQVVHITGVGKELDYTNKHYKQFTFISGTELFDIYKISDLAVTRGSANTLAELAANHIPLLIIPHPFTGGNHQYHNAKHYVKEGSAILLEQKHLTPKKLLSDIQSVLNDNKTRENMKKSLHQSQSNNAAENIAKIIIDHC